MTTWFTSDEHHWHANIIRYSKRPFSSIVEMTEELVRRHNAVVKAEDPVWHLGDFSMDERHVKVILPRLNGRHNLVGVLHAHIERLLCSNDVLRDDAAIR